jgi:hypothetical protein
LNQSSGISNKFGVVRLASIGILLVVALAPGIARTRSLSLLSGDGKAVAFLDPNTTTTPTLTDTATATSTSTSTSTPQTPYPGPVESPTHTPTPSVTTSPGAEMGTPTVTPTTLLTVSPTSSTQSSVLPTVSPSVTLPADQTGMPDITSTATFTSPLTVTLTLVPFPTVTFIFPQNSPTAELLAAPRFPGQPELTKPGKSSAWAGLSRLWVCAVILLLWLVLVGWLIISQRHLD